MPYRHKVVEGLAQLIDNYGGKGKDPFMRAIWAGLKGQVPSILQQLDNNEEAIALIERKLREVLDIKEPEAEKPVAAEVRGSTYVEIEPKPVEEIKEAVKKAPPKRRRKAVEEPVEPVEDEVGGPSQ